MFMCMIRIYSSSSCLGLFFFTTRYQYVRVLVGYGLFLYEGVPNKRPGGLSFFATVGRRRWRSAFFFSFPVCRFPYAAYVAYVADTFSNGVKAR